MIRKFHYSFIDKLCFYLSYFFYKGIIPLEVKKPKWKMWWYEFVYTIAKFKDYQINVPWKYATDTIETRFGMFKIRKNTSDAANVSPAFERRDQNYLLRLIKRLIEEDKKVLFLDIGGDLGSYSVLVANQLDKKSVKIKCFEPIEPSCLLIKENMLLNHIEDKVELHPVALLNENNDNAEMRLNIGTPGSSSMKNEHDQNSKIVSIKTRRLDDMIGDLVSEFDAIVCKIDVEGVEQEVLEGATGILQTGKEIYIMVEDFIDPKIISYLENSGWSFMAKVTTYNSWWSYKDTTK